MYPGCYSAFFCSIFYPSPKSHCRRAQKYFATSAALRNGLRLGSGAYSVYRYWALSLRVENMRIVLARYCVPATYRISMDFLKPKNRS